jgi:hypothetical protein
MSMIYDGTNGITFPDNSVLAISPLGFRSRIINGDQTVDQINSGAAQTIVAGAARAAIIDMFYANCTGANVTGQQITASDGTKRYRYTGAASVTSINHDTAISASNSRDMAGQICTLSAKLSNTVVTTVTWTAYYANTLETFGTIASPARTQIATGQFNITSTENTYAAAITMPAAATTGIEIVLSVGAQISGTWTIGDIQLERGSIPAANITVEKVEEQTQLARCQRYYWQGIPSGVGIVNSTTGFARHISKLPVTMRVAPIIAVGTNMTFYDGSVTSAMTGVLVSVYTTPDCIQFDSPTTGGLTIGRPIVALATGGGFITASARLMS